MDMCTLLLGLGYCVFVPLISYHYPAFSQSCTNPCPRLIFLDIVCCGRWGFALVTVVESHT